MAVEDFEPLSAAPVPLQLPDGWEESVRESAAELTAIFGEAEICDEHREDMEFLGVALTPGGFIQTHTVKLARLHEAKRRPGLFRTTSPGTNPESPNCFAYPIKDGGWNVIRYGKGTSEADGYWEQSVNGWTYCRFGVPVSFGAALKHAAATETDKGWYIADDAKLQRFCEALSVKHHAAGHSYQVALKKAKRKIVISCKAVAGENPPEGWGEEGSKWAQVFDDPTPLANTDLLARVYKREGSKTTEFAYFDRDGLFRFGDKDELRRSLIDRGLDAEPLLNRAINYPWTFDDTPFAGEWSLT